METPLIESKLITAIKIYKIHLYALCFAHANHSPSYGDNLTNDPASGEKM